jgi:hypothetical protein
MTVNSGGVADTLDQSDRILPGRCLLLLHVLASWTVAASCSLHQHLIDELCALPVLSSSCQRRHKRESTLLRMLTYGGLRPGQMAMAWTAVGGCWDTAGGLDTASHGSHSHSSKGFDNFLRFPVSADKQRHHSISMILDVVLTTSVNLKLLLQLQLHLQPGSQ